MTTKKTPKAVAIANPAAAWRRDLAASLVLAAGVLISTCAFAAFWAATHPETFSL
jgi:hypothetical protein